MPARKQSQSHADQFIDSDTDRPKDVDPEALNDYDVGTDDSEANSDDSEARDDHARDHYIDVGKGKLRTGHAATLGPRYKGSKVTREDAFDDESDDPFERGFSSDDESDEDPSNHRKHGNYGDDTSGSEDEDILEGSEEEDDGGVMISDDDDDDGADSENSGTDDVVNPRQADDIDRAELRRIMAEEQRTVSATLSQAAQSDVNKGKAVKTQRKSFDQMLNIRIRLQKSLVATNSLATGTAAQAAAPDEIFEGAEAAAMSLWTSLNDLRTSLQSTRTGEKRKNGVFTSESTSSSLWSHMQSLEAQERPHRQTTLDRWSTKARGASAALAPSRGRLNNHVKEQTLSDVLNGQLIDQERLIKRTKTPRSCAPLQANAGLAEAPEIYDDADFYGLMLKELLEQRNADSVTAGLEFNVAPWQAAREAKTKKVVDTKASKGRKLRYTVHEKLQNFMAPEDRTAWGERQVDELFGSLFGRKIQLGEDVISAEEDGQEEAGLMLFRS